MFNSPSSEQADTVHRALRAARKQQRVADHEIAILLARVQDERLYAAFGDATVFQYAQREHDLAPALTREYLRIARALPDCPAIEQAFAAGEIDRTKVRELVKVANEDNEQAWLERSAGLNNRQLERLVRCAGPDGSPPDPDAELEPKPAKVRICFDVDAAEADQIWQALALIRLQTGLSREEASDGVLLTMMARSALVHAEGDAAPKGGEPYRIVLHHCPTCDKVRSGDAEVSDTVIDEALCDCVVTEMRPGPTQGHSTASVPPAARMIALARHDFRCAAPNCDHRLFLDIHHLEGRGFPGAHHPKRLVPLCPPHHRAAHHGYLGVERRPDGSLAFHRRRGVEVSHVRHPEPEPEPASAA